MQAKRIYCAVTIVLLCGAMTIYAAPQSEPGTGEMKQLSISIMTDLSGPPTRPPTEDVLTPILREKTGVTATPFPQPTNLGTTAAGVAQALIAGNNLPEIITESYFPPQVDGQQVLVDQDKVWDFHDMDFLKEMFPTFTSRLEEYGSLDAWYANEETYNGTHIRITGSIDPKALSDLQAEMAGTEWARQNGPSISYYSKALRDDILQMIFPGARSDAEQEEYFLNEFDFLDPGEPWSDIPINSMDDLYNYMKKAKEIIDSQNLMDGAGRDKMIVGQLNFANNNPPSIMWSNISMYGYQWVEPPFRVADKAYYNFQAPWVEGVLEWWNKLYNEGLLDPEVFVKPDDQLNEEWTRGRFAIFPNWGNTTMNARQFADDNNLSYGYRVIPNVWPLQTKSEYSDASNIRVTYFQHFNANIITKAVEEEDLAQVAAWLDYHYSEEWDILKSWGPSDFYTGEGNNRRFKPAYKDLENYQAYGISGGKDGPYYGVIYYGAAAPPDGTNNWELSIGSMVGGGGYPYAPRYVYPPKKVAGVDYDAQMMQAWAAFHGQRLINYFPQIGWTDAELNNQPEFARIQYMWFGTHGPAIAKAITDSPENFDANYAAYQKVFDDNDWDAGMEQYQEKWTEVFNDHVKEYWR